jgi:hypothetical protein
VASHRHVVRLALRCSPTRSDVPAVDGEGCRWVGLIGRWTRSLEGAVSSY